MARWPMGVEYQWAILWPRPFIGAFPLTPAHSLGERENVTPTHNKITIPVVVWFQVHGTEGMVWKYQMVVGPERQTTLYLQEVSHFLTCRHPRIAPRWGAEIRGMAFPGRWPGLRDGGPLGLRRERLAGNGTCQCSSVKGRSTHCLRPDVRGDFPRSFRRLTLRSATGPAQRAQPYQLSAYFGGKMRPT